MNILIMGPAGSGKGTMSEFIENQFHVTHISTGDMFRAAIAQGTELGKKASEYMNQGKLVPDEITINMTKERLMQDDCKNGYLLDGFPRTLAQAVAFEELVKGSDLGIQIVINLDVTVDQLAPRIVNRRLCKNCGAIYNILTLPPKEEGICDVCKTPLVHRPDDTLESLKTRMEEYYNLTAPVINYFEEKGLVTKVDAGRPIEEVWQDIKSALERFE